MKKSKRDHNFIKAGCLFLASVVCVNSVAGLWKGETLLVNAMGDTLPGVEELRNEYIYSTKTYKILEVVPDQALAEVGFYLGGEEPFLPLYDEETNGYVNWKEKLLSIKGEGEQSDKDAREAYMDAVLKDAENVALYYQDVQSVPFEYAPYKEYLATDPEAENAEKLPVSGYTLNGYLVEAEQGDWDATFVACKDRNISLDSINNSTTTAYYKVTFNEDFPGAFTVEELKVFAENYRDARVYIRRPEGHLEYWATAEEAWTYYEEEYEAGIVSGGDVVSSGDMDSVSGGNVFGEKLTDFYFPHFSLVTPLNPVEVGDFVYLLDSKEQVDAGNGNYSFVESEVGVEPWDEFAFGTTYIYYTGGITNKEIIKNQVFGLEEEEYGLFNIDVEVMTPAMLNELFLKNEASDSHKGVELLKQFDLIYINGGTSMRTAREAKGMFSTSNDIDANVMASLAMYIATEEAPCIFDMAPFVEVGEHWYTFVNGMGSTNFARLVSFLLQPEYNGTGTDIANHFYSTDLSWWGTQLNNADICDNNTNPFAGYIEDKEWTADTGATRDGSFVKGSTWFVNNLPGEANPKTLQNKGLFNGAAYSWKQIGGGYFTVWDEIRVENLYREEQQGKKPLDTAVYDSTIFRYIVNYKTQRQLYKDSLNVLCIEPAGKGTGSITVDTIKAVTNVNSVNITVMSMNEFIGKIDDLNATYDMIYFGASSEGLNVSNNETVYNDSDMNGLLYSHVGDLVEVFASVNGLLDTDYTHENRNADTLKETVKHRYTGNDLTVEKYNQLLEYLEAYYPVVVDDGLLTEDGLVNEACVDNSSYIYEFLKLILEETNRKNVFTESELKSNPSLFAFYVNRPKISLYSEKYNDLIMTDEKYLVEGEQTSNVTQIAIKNGKYYLEYDFIIRNDSAYQFGENYVCKLYLDDNADGKFSKGDEELDLTAENILNVDTNQKVSSTDELQAGVHYQLSREVPDSFFGCITWQLEVYQKDCEAIRAVKKGYTKLKNDKATQIKILQIYFADASKAINLEQSIGKYNEIKEDYEQPSGNYVTNHFHNVASKIKDDYILDITTIHKSTFDSGLFADGTRINLDDYDMLILGFSDGVSDGGDWQNGIDTNLKYTPEGASNNIMDFIASGKSVLFAHDMTSTINVPETKTILNNTNQYVDNRHKNQSFRYVYKSLTTSDKFTEYLWGYSINAKLRDVVGMDTYGITLGNTNDNSAYQLLSLGVSLERASDGKFMLDTEDNGELIQGSSALANRVNDFKSMSVSEPVKNEEGQYEYGVKDVAYAPNSNRQETVSEVQGFTAYALRQRANSLYNGEDTRGYRNGIGYSIGNNSTSTSAEKINDGQITNYPYYISSSIELANTHNQYYALDMNGDSDRDKQTDIVVWYNLSGGNFDKAPGDVKNNYYIYSKGNVIYTGMGDNAKKSVSGAVTVQEAKLFINTMVAAYNAGIRTPEIVTMDSSGVTTDVMYNYYDTLIEDIPLVTEFEVTEEDTMLDIEFRVDDLNMTQGDKSVEVGYYVAVPATAPELTINGGTNVGVKASELPNMGSMVSEEMYFIDVTEKLMDCTVGEMNGNALKANTTYSVEIPAKFLLSGNADLKRSFFISAKTIMEKQSIAGGNITTVTDYTYKELQCVNVELFDLD